MNETRSVVLPTAPGLDVFISYARENRPVAEQLADALKADSLRVWWDREIPGGAEFADVIEAQLHGARVVLVLWSADSVHSSFVRDESARALSAGKLLPARIEDVQLPLGFGQIHTLDLISANPRTAGNTCRWHVRRAEGKAHHSDHVHRCRS